MGSERGTGTRNDHKRGLELRKRRHKRETSKICTAVHGNHCDNSGKKKRPMDLKWNDCERITIFCSGVLVFINLTSKSIIFGSMHHNHCEQNWTLLNINRDIVDGDIDTLI